jgi:hypothetical protein
MSLSKAKLEVRESEHNATICGVVHAVNESWTAIRRTRNPTGFFQDLGILWYSQQKHVKYFFFL